MPTQVFIVPVDPGAYEVAGATRRQYDVADEIGVVFAILQAAAAGNDNSLVKALRADAAGNLAVTLAGQAAAGPVSGIGNTVGFMNQAADAAGNPSNNSSFPVGALPWLWNGASYDRGRDASAANLATQRG